MVRSLLKLRVRLIDISLHVLVSVEPRAILDTPNIVGVSKFDDACHSTARSFIESGIVIEVLIFPVKGLGNVNKPFHT